MGGHVIRPDNDNSALPKHTMIADITPASLENPAARMVK